MKADPWSDHHIMLNVMSGSKRKEPFLFEDLGIVDFAKAWEYQRAVFHEIISKKIAGECSSVDCKNRLIFCEHPHVYTLGKSGNKNNLLIPVSQLKKINATYYHIDRGGDITYHGPGQIVGYPVFDLEQFNIMAKKYIFMLEEAVIRLLQEFNITGQRKKSATGIWIDPFDVEKARKICAIGVKISRSVTMHGFALNVNTDLNYYDYINPCGFNSKQVTSIKNEVNKAVEVDSVKESLRKKIDEVFKIQNNL